MRKRLLTHLTPYDDRYTTSDRADVALLIYPGEHAHEDITERLGIIPSDAKTKGDVWISAHTGNKNIVPHTRWFLFSEGHVESRDARRHLDWLIDKLMPVKDALHEIQALPGLRMTIDCVWWSAAGRGGPTLWPEQMAALAELDLALGFDIYYYGEDDD